MDYRRRYLRKLANQSQDNKIEEKINVNKVEEKINPVKNEEKQNIQNIYLQKLLVKNSNSPNNSSVKIPIVNQGSPFSHKLKDILSTEEANQKPIKYVVQKKEDKYGFRSPVSKQINYDENSSLYKISKNTNVNKFDNQNDDNNNQINQKSKNDFPQYYLRKNNNVSNFQEESNNPKENKRDNNGKDNYNSNTYFKKRFQVSASATNIAAISSDEKENNEKRAMMFRKNRQNNIKNNENSDNDSKAVSKDKINKTQTRYRYFRGGNDKKNENEGETKEDNRQKEKIINTIPINLKAGNNNHQTNQNKNEESNNYDIKVNRKRSKDFIDKNKFSEITTPIINKKYTYVRQRFKKEDSEEKNNNKERNTENTKENVIDFKIVSDSETITNTRYKRKYGRFSHNSENDLTFKDENEIINYISKKYNQDKIIELFKINNYEEDLNNMRDKLNEEIQRNSDKDKKIKLLENNIEEKNAEIENKKKDINNKEKEIEKINKDTIFYKNELQKKEKENNELKNKMNKKENNINNDIKKINKEYETLKIEYNELVKENNKLIKDYDDLLKENDLIKSDYNDLLKDYEDLKKEQNKPSVKYNNKNDEELNKIKNELKKAIIEKENLQKQLNSKKNIEIKKIDNTKNENFLKEIENLKNEIKNKNEEFSKIKEEKEKLKRELNILNSLNDKAIDQNYKMKEDIVENTKQNQDLLKIKDKYYKLLDDYKLLTHDCELLRNDKDLIQSEYKQFIAKYKKNNEERRKVEEENDKLKEDYEQLLKEMETLKNKNKTQQTTNVTILNNLNNTNIISKLNKNEIKKDESAITKSMLVKTIGPENIKINESKNGKNINNILYDVNNNINDIIKQINNDINNNEVNMTKSTTGVSLPFNITSDNINKSEKKIIEEEKKEFRISKAIQKIKKRQGGEGNSSSKLMDKELENKIQKKSETFVEEEKNNNDIEDNKS